jgi:hypothetical protein
VNHRQRPSLPVAECIGVLFGALAWDWLADGRASILRALCFSLSSGAALYLIRYVRHRRHPSLPDQTSQD